MATTTGTARKTPQDHKPKAGAEKGATIDGIKIVFPTDLIDDWEFGEDYAESQAGKTEITQTAAALRVARRLFGPAYDQMKAKALNPETGIVSAKKMRDYIEQAFEALSEESPN